MAKSSGVGAPRKQQGMRHVNLHEEEEEDTVGWGFTELARDKSWF